MKSAKIEVVPYDAEWKNAFEKIKNEIELAVGGCIARVEHVGSTSVEGMSAKPCIDIDVVIEDSSMLGKVIEGLSAIGYIHEGDLGIKGREAFKYLNKPHLMKHHLYVCQSNAEELRRHITFRNFLRENPDFAAKYSRVKESAAALFPNDIEKYIEYKSPCIEEIYALCGLID